MRFFRSSEAHKSQRSKSRFSFRRHSDDDADVVKPPPPVPSSSSRKALSQSQPPRPPAYPLQQQQTTGKASVSSLTSTFVSSASTSAGSSVTSPSAIHRASSGVQQEDPLDDRSSSSDKIVTSSSSSALKRTSDSRTSTETDETDFVRTPSESSFFATTPRESFQEENDLVPQNILPLQNQHSMARTHSSSSNSSGLGSRSSSQRHSLVGYRQLEFSMSYKNRKTLVDDPLAPPGCGGSSSSSSSNSLRSSFNRRSETYRDSYNGGASAAHLSHIDELSPVHASAEQKPSGDPSPPHASGDHSTDDVEVRMTEANVAALQTRRALQQMVLSMEDDDYDSDDSDYRYDSRSSASYSGGIIHVGADDYRKFQFRLKQLEDLCSDQARKQADMEHTIERQVQQRTAKVVEAMEKKIAMYKQAKDLEVEREIQRRLSTESRGSVSRDSAMVFTGSSPLLLPPSMISSDADLKGKPLDKIFHPRRTRRRMELLKEREEQQKKEMEQFREFIRNTEMRSTQVTRSTMFMTPKNDPHARDSSPQTTQAARESIMALKDPHLTEDLLAATQNELIEMICVLRKHVSVQENQLDEAKKLISAAIEAREEAEDTAREAVELTMELDSRLERASQEMIELRRSSEFSMRSSYLDRNSQFTASFRSSTATNNGMTTSQTNLPRTLSFPR